MDVPIIYYYDPVQTLNGAGEASETFTTSSAWAYVPRSTRGRTPNNGVDEYRTNLSLWVDNYAPRSFAGMKIGVRGELYRVLEQDTFTRPGYALLTLDKTTL